jgi:Ca2+-binding RTX toxin-like protein
MGRTLTATNDAELKTALANAQSGDTVLVGGGRYTALSINTTGWGEGFTAPVVLQPLDPNDEPIFSGLALRNVDNLVIDDVVFDYTFQATDPIYIRPFEINGSTDVVVRNSLFTGDVAAGLGAESNGFPYGIGLSVRGSDGVTVEGNTVEGFHRGVVVSESTDIAVVGNNIHGLRMDGVNVSEVQGVRIEGNWIHDFKRSLASLDHADMIQFWTAGTDAPSTDITIRNNLLDLGGGAYTQSIFMRNELVDTGAAGEGMYYRNVLIEHNTILNAHLHGITVGETDGLTVRGNLVLHDDGGYPDGRDAEVEIPDINIAATSRNVAITGNWVAGINGHTGQNGWVVEGNTLVQDQNPLRPNHVSDLFVASSLSVDAAGRAPVALPGGALGGATFGRPDWMVPSGPQALFHIQTLAEDDGALVFDASFSRDLPAGARLLWAFSDGSTAEGIVVRKDSAVGQRLDAVLTVVDGSGAVVDRAVAGASVDGARVVTMEGGRLFWSQGGQDTVVLDGQTDGVRLGTPNAAPTVAPANLARVEQFRTLDLAFTLGDATRAGEVLRVHTTLLVQVDANGQLVARLTDANGQEVVLRANAGLLDGGTHAFTLSATRTGVTLSMDGEQVAAADLAAPVRWTTSYGLMFGNPWGSANTDALLSNLTLDVNLPDYDATGTTVLVGAPVGLFLEGTEGADRLSGAEGHDTLLGLGGNDRLVGEEGNDVLQTGTGTDLAYGGGGRDTLEAMGTGALYGGDGEDHLQAQGAPGARLYGGSGNDTLLGTATAQMWGGDGSDVLRTGEQGGQAWGGDGNDLFEGGMGSQSARGDTGNDTLVGGRGADSLFGGNDGDTLDGGEGADALYGDAGDDSVVGGGGDDWMSGGSGQDSLWGGLGADTINGRSGHDTLWGGDGGDALVGESGNDALFGGSGNDTLAGGLGRDTLEGGEGTDRFVWARAADMGNSSGADSVRGFLSGTDQLDVSGWFDVASARFVGTDAFTGQGPEIRVQGNALVFDTNGDGRGDARLVLEEANQPLTAFDAQDFV